MKTGRWFCCGEGKRRLTSGLISVILAGFLLIALTLPVTAEEPSCAIANTSVDNAGEVCDGSGCTWYYSLCQSEYTLSHWVLGICAELEQHIIEVGYTENGNDKVVLSPGEWSVGNDPETGMFGLKIRNVTGHYGCFTFYVKVDQHFGKKALEWASKYHDCDPKTGTVMGPDCASGETALIKAGKFNDLNRNGSRDADEPGLPGWSFCLSSDCRTTLADGYTESWVVNPGTYLICEVLQDGWTNSSPGNNLYCKQITVAAGQEMTVEFGNYQDDGQQYSQVQVLVYNDLNRNGSQDAGEPGMKDWDVCLINGDCKTTGADGTTGYWLVKPGDYILCEILKDGWTKSGPSKFLCHEVRGLEAGESRTIAFGNYTEYAWINACLYNDLDRDGARDADEPGLPDRVISLNGDSRITGTDGCTEPWMVPPGSYSLCQTREIGWVNSDPGKESRCKEVAVSAGEAITVQFGSYDHSGVAVGIEVFPVDKAGLMAPWLVLLVIVLGLGGAALAVKRCALR